MLILDKNYNLSWDKNRFMVPEIISFNVEIIYVFFLNILLGAPGRWVAEKTGNLFCMTYILHDDFSFCTVGD